MPIPEAIAHGPQRPWLEPPHRLTSHLPQEQQSTIYCKRLHQLEFLKDLKEWDAVEDDDTWHQTRLGFAIIVLIFSLELKIVTWSLELSVGCCLDFGFVSCRSWGCLNLLLHTRGSLSMFATCSILQDLRGGISIEDASPLSSSD